MKQKFPAQFIKKIREILAEKEIDKFLARCTEPLPKTIRLTKNLDTIPADWILTDVAGIPTAKKISRENMKTPLGKTLQHYTGQIYIASLASLLSAKILNPEPESKVLDMCAAPGSKATFLSEMIGENGVLVANELSASRSKKLASNLDRVGAINTIITQINGTRFSRFFDQEFDFVLLDAPCSSEGFGRKNSEFFAKFWNEKKIYECAKIQKQLIISAFEVLRVEGEMVYSTCTSSVEENEEVLEHLLQTFPDEVEILPINLPNIPHKNGVAKNSRNLKISEKIQKNVVRLFPHLFSEIWDSEIFFISLIRKKKTVKKELAQKMLPQSSFRVFSKNQAAEKFARICKTYGIDRKLFAKYTVIEKNSEIFLTNKNVANFAKRNRHQRSGLKIFDKNQNLANYFAIIYGKYATKNFLELNNEQKEKFLAGYDLEIENNFDLGQIIIIKFGEFSLGTAKVLSDKKLRNKLEKGLVMN